MTVLENDLGSPAPAPHRSPRITPRRALTALVAVAAVAAVVLGAIWVLTLNSSALAMARDRDAALVAAQQAAVALNTLNYKDVDAGLDQWEQVSTGSVLEEFRQNRTEYAKAVSDSKRATVATIADAAVGELDERAGTARVLVGVDVQVTPEGQQPTLTRQRLQMEMTRTDTGWKVSRLNPVRSPTAGG
jgi:Mce-associated membrane protein